MWAIRILNGPEVGKIIPLREGVQKIGRGESCDIRFATAGVSKEHLEIQVLGNKVILKDLNSRNGTLVNGVRIQGASVRLGDKVSLHDTLFDFVMSENMGRSIVPQTAGPLMPPPQPRAMQMAPTPSPTFYQPPPMQMAHQSSAPAQTSAPAEGQTIKDFTARANEYLEEVVLPGVYRLAEVFDFKFVIMGFCVCFVLMVTMLAMLPMKIITAESISTESKRRAATIARVLANSNEKTVRQGDISSFSTDLVLREEGLTDIYIIGRDGSIIAPPEKVGSSPKEASFIKIVKGTDRPQSDQLGDGTIAASHPILVFDPELQQNVAKAHAVVIYDPGSLAFDDGRAFSLFIQVLLIASVLGFVLYYFLYKMIEHPFASLNEQLDLALQQKKDHASTKIQFDVLQKTLVNVNSLINRALNGNIDSTAPKANKDQQFAQMLMLFAHPAIVINRDGVIVGLNNLFEIETAITAERVINQNLSYIPNEALQKNIQALMQQGALQAGQIFSDQLDFNGSIYSVNCQSIAAADGSVEYYFVTLSPPVDQSQGGAA